VNGNGLDGNGEVALPVWARHEAFPEAGEGFGWLDRKGGRHPLKSELELSEAIRTDRESAIILVWTPDSPYCRVPEEIEALEEPIREVRKGWATEDLAEAERRMMWVGSGVAVLTGYSAFRASAILSGVQRASGVEVGWIEGFQWILKPLIASTTLGLAYLVFLIYAFIPWYQAQKRMREIHNPQGRPAPLIPLIRFETWLDFQKSPVTWSVLAMISAAFLAQVFHDGSIMTFHSSVLKAGLVKDAYRGGEYFRLLTAPMLHGGVVHFAMNSLALLYLGKRLEVFARWPHLPMVFLFSALVGGEASARFLDAPSVGASGGLMGWLGFLLVFETLHTKLVPRSSRRRLIGGVVMTALIGLVGYRFIDNAAHFGGLLAGMAYAGIVFPKSGSVMRPKMNLADRIIGVGSLAVIAGSAFLAIMKIQG
jgi:membrane associated rhomboid family serine protease